MHFRVSHCEQHLRVVLRGEIAVPLRLAEAAADAVDVGEAFRIADGDFIGGDPYDAAVLVV